MLAANLSGQRCSGHGRRVDQPVYGGSSAAPACWRFAHVQFDEAHAKLYVHGREVELDRSGQALLSYFLRHPGVLVHKDTLLNIGWSGRVVAENTLAKAISRLRQHLGDDNGELLRVVHGYGYRLLADVEALPIDAATTTEPLPVLAPAASAASAPPPVPAAWWRGGTGAAGVLLVVAISAFALVRLLPHAAPVSSTSAVVPVAGSIAVLPFIDLSPKHDQGYFADGLADELLDNLQRIDRLQVAARTSSFALRNSTADVHSIGTQLGVRHVLEGSVRSSGERVRVTVQLIDTRNGFHLWSQTYDRPMSELFALQDEIVSRIVEALRIELAPEALRAAAHHGTRNPEAFRPFLYARSIFQDDETAGRRSIVASRRAVALDPQFFDAWLNLALLLDFDSVIPDSREEVLANKREALSILQRLIQQRPQRADLYLHRGDTLFWHWQDIAGAERDFEHAAQLGLREDDDWMVKMSRVYAASGRMQAAMALTGKATARDPKSVAWVVRAYHLLGVGRIDEARATAQHALLQRPQDEHAYYYLGLCDLLQGQPRAATEHFDESTNTFRLAGLAMAEQALGHPAVSEQHLQRLIERYGHVTPYLVADIYAWRGDNTNAYLWMQRSVDVRDASLMYLAFDPLLAPLRKDPRWPGLLRQVKLDSYLLHPAAERGGIVPGTIDGGR